MQLLMKIIKVIKGILVLYLCLFLIVTDACGAEYVTICRRLYVDTKTGERLKGIFHIAQVNGFQRKAQAGCGAGWQSGCGAGAEVTGQHWLQH